MFVEVSLYQNVSVFMTLRGIGIPVDDASRVVDRSMYLIRVSCCCSGPKHNVGEW